MTPEGPRLEWPKIVSESMLGTLHEKQMNDRDMIAHTLKVVDKGGAHLLGVVSVTKSKHCDLVSNENFIRYVLRVNGTPVKIMEFTERKHGAIGRLLRVFDAELGEMVETDYKK